MSNNNGYWGRRYGNFSESKGLYYRVKQMASGVSRSGAHQIGLESGSPRAKQAEKDKKEFARRGRPAFVFSRGKKKIAGPIWAVE